MRDQNRCVTLVKLYPRGFRLLVIRLVAANVPVANYPWQTPLCELPLANSPLANIPVTDESVVLVVQTIEREKQKKFIAHERKYYWRRNSNSAGNWRKKLLTHESISHRRKTFSARAKKLFAHENDVTSEKKLVARDQTSHTQTQRHLLTTIRRHTLKRYVRQTHQSASEIQIQTTNQITERVGSNFYDKKQ